MADLMRPHGLTGRPFYLGYRMTKKRPLTSIEDEAPCADKFPVPRPGTRMLLLPAPQGDPMRLAEQTIEALGREPRQRTVKTGKKKRKVAR